MSWLVRNWHLKLGALALATVLYTGFVYSDSFTEDRFPGVPVEAINQPNAVYPLTEQFGTVEVRYRLASDAPRVSADSFEVTVDLSEYDMDRAPESQVLSVNVRSLGNGLEVIDWEPTTVAVALDRIAQREVPVSVDRGEVPEGFSIGIPQLSEETVIASGPASQLGRVDRAVARVQIFESGIDVTRQVTLIPVDVDGRQILSVELVPSTVTVEIDVRAEESSKTVSIRPSLTGTVADGFELLSVSVEPAVVTLLGMPDALAPVELVDTVPLTIAGLEASTSLDAEIALPAGTRLASGTPRPTVEVEIGPATATRTFLVGVECEGASQDLACLPQQGQLSLTVSGPASVLADLQAGALTPVLDVADLGPGDHQVTPSVSLPNGVELVSLSPGQVTVTLQPPQTPSPPPG